MTHSAEEISWRELQQALRQNHEVIMDSDSVARLVRAFEFAYKGESAQMMDLLRDLPVPVLHQISSAAKMMGEMAGLQAMSQRMVLGIGQAPEMFFSDVEELGK